MRKVFDNANLMYTLFEDEAGYLLSVTCGTIALYEGPVRLDANETAQYQAEGEDYLTTLAHDIRKNSEKYRERWIAWP